MQLLQWQSFVYLMSIWSKIINPVPRIGTPLSDAVDHVNPMIGNGGDTPNGSGGMIPSVAPPFGMTRWVAQTRENYVSVTPYNHTDRIIRGFQGTHQPAIWMGESGQVVVVPGLGEVKPAFEDRGLSFEKEGEIATASYYRVDMKDWEGNGVKAEMSATSRAGHLRFTFLTSSAPYVLVQATRASVIGSADPSNVTYPLGSVFIDPIDQSISGHNPERQDFIIGPNPAPSFAGYFYARFSQPFTGWGIAANTTLHSNETSRSGEPILSGYVQFANDTKELEVRVGVSFISIEQASKNLEKEIPDGTRLEETAYKTRSAWKEKLEMIELEGATDANKTTFYTAFYHTLQYPYEQDEDGMYYSGYDDKVHKGVSYTGYSIWDTFRAQWAWQILFVPERIPDMIMSMLQDYKEGGWLPMWKNIVETNIMIGTHADSLIAEAVVKGFGDKIDVALAWEAVKKDATVPPEGDGWIEYADRQENVGYEVRAGLTSVYEEEGWVADDIHSEAASRTLDYAYDDYATALLAHALSTSNVSSVADFSHFLTRSLSSYKTIFNPNTGFMEARNANGTWAGEDRGWTEGDKWAYTFNVVHDIPGLVDLKGGNKSFVEFLDEHFEGGHNDHTNEPSHHIPYLYSLVGAASKTQERVRVIARSDYNETVDGLAGNEDCGQMSAWYLFSALGFYPVDPASGKYVIGAPFFDKAILHLPGASHPLEVTSKGATNRPYVLSASVDGVPFSSDRLVITHEQIEDGADIVFEMADCPQQWGSDTVYKEDPCNLKDNRGGNDRSEL